MTRTSARRLPDPKLFFPLLLLFLAACEPQGVEVQIPVEVHWKDQPLSCDSTPVALQDLRFYLSDIKAQMKDGSLLPVKPVTDGAWHGDRVVMLDLEDGQGSCDGGTPETNATINVVLPAGDIQYLQFVMGVPFDLNHSDPLQALPPLDDSAMHWHWRSGYKFLRAGVKTEDDGFWLHLGSSGCEGTTRNITSCSAPNWIAFVAPGFVSGKTGLVLQLDELFDGIPLNDGTSTDCASGPFEDSCTQVFENLALSGASDERVDVFRMKAL